MSFGRAASCFANAVHSLMLPHPYGDVQAIESSLKECYEAHSALKGLVLTDNGKKWVSELEEFIGTSQAVSLKDKAQELDGDVTGQAQLSQLVLDLQAWTSEKHRQGL